MASVVTTRNTSWQTPRTWSTGELVTASIMNVHVRDNLNALKSPAYFLCEIDEGADYTIAATTTFTNIDGTDLAATVTTGGGNWLIGFSGVTYYSAGSATRGYFTVAVDGTNYVGDDGLMLGGFGTNTYGYTSFTTIIRGLSAASHAFTLRWKTGATGTYGLYAGAGTSGFDFHPVFWGIELV